MRKKNVFRIFKWGLSLGLLFWLYSNVSWQDFFGLVHYASPVFMIVAFAIIALNTVFCCYKWQLLLRADSLEQPLGQLIVSYMIGWFVSLFLPSNIGGDSYRVYDLGSRTKQGVRSFTSVFAERFSGFLALSLIGFIGGIAGYTLLKEKSIILVLALFLMIIVGVLVLSISSRFVKFCLKLTRLDHFKPIMKTYESFVETFRKYGGNPKLVSQVMILSILFHFGYISVVYLYSCFLGLDYPYYIFIVFVPIIALFEALPISIYGIGIRDTAYVYFFAQVGMPSEHALALALLHLVINLFVSSLGGLLFLFRKHKMVRVQSD